MTDQNPRPTNFVSKENQDNIRQAAKRTIEDGLVSPEQNESDLQSALLKAFAEAKVNLQTQGESSKSREDALRQIVGPLMDGFEDAGLKKPEILDVLNSAIFDTARKSFEEIFKK